MTPPKRKREQLEQEYKIWLNAPKEGPEALEGLEIRLGAPREEDFLELRTAHFECGLEFGEHYRGRTEIRLLGYLYFSSQNAHFLKSYAHRVPPQERSSGSLLGEAWMPIYLMYSSLQNGGNPLHFLDLRAKWLVLMYGNDGETMSYLLESEDEALLFWQTLPKEAFLNALEFYATWTNSC